VKELFSLVEDCVSEGRINNSMFPNDPNGMYLSSSPVSGDWDDRFWLVNVGYGTVSEWGEVYEAYPLRLVRDVEAQEAIPRKRLSVWVDPEFSEATDQECLGVTPAWRYTLFVREEIGVGVTMEGIVGKYYKGDMFSNNWIIDRERVLEWFGTDYLEPYNVRSVFLCSHLGGWEFEGAVTHQVFGTDDQGYFVEGSGTHYLLEADYLWEDDWYGIQTFSVEKTSQVGGTARAQ
jgi:hypothetical protein